MAFKGSPSSQHQHCTDEAQKAETVRASDVLVALFFQIEMPMEDEFPKSVVLHFPPSVYQRTGANAMLPKLLQILNAEDLRCVQFLRGGKVRVSFREQADRDHFLSEGMRLDDEDIPVTRDAEKVTVLYVRDLPYEVASDDLVDFLSTFGEVLTVERSVAADTPNLCNGNRVLKMVLKDDLPYFISICGYQCRVWYRGQPIQCFVCRQLGHRAQSCPLSGRCRYCHQVGHMARNCAQAWDPTPPAVSHVIRTDVDESSVSDSGTIIADETSVPDSDPIPMTSEASSKDNLPAAVPDPVVKVSSKPPDKSPADPVKVVPVEFVPDSDPVNIIVAASPVDPVPAADLVDKPPVKDKPLVPVPDKVPAADPEKPRDKTSTVATDDDVPMPAPTKPRAKSSRAVATAEVFCARLSKSFNPLKFPDINATGKDGDSKAKVHLRSQVKTVFSSRDIAISNSDLRTWSESDLRDVSTLFCEMLSVRQDYLVDFVFGIVKSYWNNAKKV